MERLMELLELRNAYLFNSSRFGFSKKFLKQRLKEINKEIKEQERKLKWIINP